MTKLTQDPEAQRLVQRYVRDARALARSIRYGAGSNLPGQSGNLVHLFGIWSTLLARATELKIPHGRVEDAVRQALADAGDADEF